VNSWDKWWIYGKSFRVWCRSPTRLTLPHQGILALTLPISPLGSQCDVQI